MKDWKQQIFIISQFWRPEVWNQSVGRTVPSGGSRGQPTLCLSSNFPWLQAFFGWWKHKPLLCLSSHGLFSVCFSSFLIGKLIISHQRWYLRTLNLITSAKILFPNKFTFTGSRWSLSWGQFSIHCRFLWTKANYIMVRDAPGTKTILHEANISSALFNYIAQIHICLLKR